MPDFNLIIGVCREDSSADVDEAYGKGTYARLFPYCPQCDGEDPFCVLCNGERRVTAKQAEQWFRQNPEVEDDIERDRR